MDIKIKQLGIAATALSSLLLLSSISNADDKKQYERSDSNPTLEAWAEEYPDHLEMYLEMKDTSKPTEFGGNVPYSKLIRFPQLTELWGGYAFAHDFNEERGHYYSQIDQYETGRNNREFLNGVGLKKFKGQPGACMNCHSGWVPELVREMGWEDFNRTPYWDTVAHLESKHGKGINGSEMGSTCADCHTPDDMSLRVTRPAYINAMMSRGYEADERYGIKATQAEMRNHVCEQCHVEYYFKGKDKLLTFPWDQWPKDRPFKIEMMEAYYDRVAASGEFAKDWTHSTTKAPMLKMQHPEAEMTSSGRHTRDGVACVDCHMPKKIMNGEEVTDHNLDSPLNDLVACKSCHSSQNESDIRKMVQDVQRHTSGELNRAEVAILALIGDIKTVRQELALHKDFRSIQDQTERDAAISKAIEPALDMHRRASMRWDFVGAENSTGIHSPREAWRILDDAEKQAREGQIKLNEAANKYGISFRLTSKGAIPVAPPVLHPGNIVGSEPPPITMQADNQCER
ncbi:ammonia-forming cytochrome c nitrite reductase subunit c552 [Agaribacterium sp. ZY112]|uniref:ammonia-forming cytochrome c nitrite reductase subunit c552 n=1 Tax=Agaribacterium sp. ZY112 TaxID=3233574 RepID=UPI0035240DBF